MGVADAAPARTAVGRAAAPTIGCFQYQGDHGVLLDKEDDWRDPSSERERQIIGAPADCSRVPLASYTRGETVRAHVRIALPAAPRRGAIVTLLGRSADRRLAMLPASRPAPAVDGATILAFDVRSAEPLPDEIGELATEVRWELSIDGRTTDLGTRRHVILVTAGPSLRASSWPVAGGGAEPPRADHNAFTAFRLQHVARIARGARTATAAAEKIWRYAMHHYDLGADGDLNPWQLLDEQGAGQCMTVAAFIEAAVRILGFSAGRVVYVYPSLSRPRTPTTPGAPEPTATPHPLIPGAFTIEAHDYDVRGQFRYVTGSAADAPGARHSARQAALHRGAHGIERLKMRDWNGELHNYATAFVVDDDGPPAYFGGGYSAGPYHTAQDFLAAACTAVVWTYESEADAWETICDEPGPGYWWSTGEPYRR